MVKKMPKIVILGSCKHEPYEILAVPLKNKFWNTDKGYKLATERFYPAIDKADFIIVYCPNGVGKHTQKDIEYAKKMKKKIIFVYNIIKMKLACKHDWGNTNFCKICLSINDCPVT